MVNIHLDDLEQKQKDLLLRVDDLHKSYVQKFYGRKDETLALRGISFSLDRGETIGIVGESGCGKSTLAKILVGLETQSRGKISFLGDDLKFSKDVRKNISLVFQDPYASLNPRMKVSSIIKEPLAILSRKEIIDILESFENENIELDPKTSRKEIIKIYSQLLLSHVGLNQEIMDKYSYQLSGGQRQRVGIARALATSPWLMILDEPVSSLDVSVQAGVLETIREIKERTNMSIIFITHDLRVARYICDRVIVMYGGQIMEDSPVDRLYGHPCHPYSRFLLSAIPKKPGETIVEIVDNIDNVEIDGTVEQDNHVVFDLLSGCPYQHRCEKRQDACDIQPALAQMTDGRLVACHFPY